jgi:multidrug efflux system outer membrane protein
MKFVCSICMHVEKAYRLFLFCILFVSGACSVGPRYRQPTVMDNTWAWKDQVIKDTTTYPVTGAADDTLAADSGTDLRTTTAPLANKWWLLFHDDTLNQLMETALNNNLNLKTSALRILESRGMVTVAKANYYPGITIDPSITRNQLSGNRPNQFSNSSLPQLTLTTITVPINMSYELDVWGKFRRSVESAEATMRASQADYEVIKLSLTADIAANYYTLRLIDKQIQLYTDALQLRKQNLNLTRGQYEAGLTSKLDLIQAEIEAASVESQLIDANRTRALSENAIAVLCGIPTMNFTIAPQAGFPKVPPVPLEIPSDLLQRRPDIAEAEQQLIYANAQIGVAQAAFFPSVKLTGASAGFLSSRFDNLFERQSTTWLAGVGVSIPVFTGGRNAAQRTIAEARLKESELAYRQVVLNAFREVQDAMANLEYRTQQSVVQQKALAFATSSADMSKELYKKGLTTYLNVIVADRAVLDAQNAFIVTTGQRLIYSISLIKALGGGWNGTMMK